MMKFKYISIFLIFVLIIIVVIHFTKKDKQLLESKEFEINNIKIHLEIADDIDEKITGLKNRKRLNKNSGMIFVYTDSQIMHFWMKDTLIPLDIAYIKGNGEIAEIYKMKELSKKVYSSKLKVKYVIEMSKDWFFKHNIKIGDKVEGLEKL